jgi:hypothetical protein
LYMVEFNVNEMNNATTTQIVSFLDIFSNERATLI